MRFGNPNASSKIPSPAKPQYMAQTGAHNGFGIGTVTAGQLAPQYGNMGATNTGTYHPTQNTKGGSGNPPRIPPPVFVPEDDPRYGYGGGYYGGSRVGYGSSGARSPEEIARMVAMNWARWQIPRSSTRILRF